MNTRIIVFFVLIVMPFVMAPGGCSVPDSSDMADFEAAIQSLPPTDLTKLHIWAAKRKIIKWLQKQGNKFVGDVVCGDLNTDPSNEYPISFPITTVDLILALTKLDLSYVEIGEEIARREQAAFVARGAKLGYKHNLRCRFRWYTGFDPDTVAAEARGKNTVKPGDMHRIADEITVDEIAEEMLASPVAPLPGFVPGGAFGRLLPSLCGLGADWGCPDSPQYPGGAPDGTSSGGDWK